MLEDVWTKRIAALAAAIVSVIGALALAGVFDDADVTPQPVLAQAPVPATVAVDGPDANAEPDRQVELNADARQVVKDVAEDPEANDFGPDLRGTDESGPVAEHEGPLATPNFPGCTTRILPTNWSSRVVPMSEVDGIGLHYTAGGNIAGLADMNGLTGFASSPSAGVSWHFLIDAEGNCYYQVPLSKKAWTIGNLNSETVNIEVIGRGSEGTYPASAAGAAKLRQVVRELGRRLDIPMRVGAVSNCHVTVSGIITHWQGGVCAGNHGDIRPYVLESVVAMIAADPCGERCKARRRQRNVIRGRVRRHDETHARARKVPCRSLDRNPPSAFGKPECRELKLKHRRQRASIRKARATYRAL